MTLSFSIGQTVGAQQCTIVFALEDTLIEDDESFNISLATSSSDASVVAFTPEASVATVTIVQDPNDSKSLNDELACGHNTMTMYIIICH